MPARRADLGRQPLRAQELVYHERGLFRLVARARVEEELRAVTGDHHPASEMLPRLVVEVERSQAFAKREAMLLVVQLDLDAPVLVAHGADDRRDRATFGGSGSRLEIEASTGDEEGNHTGPADVASAVRVKHASIWRVLTSSCRSLRQQRHIVRTRWGFNGESVANATELARELRLSPRRAQTIWHDALQGCGESLS